jgi:hypothetical protein
MARAWVSLTEQQRGLPGPDQAKKGYIVNI